MFCCLCQWSSLQMRGWHVCATSAMTLLRYMLQSYKPLSKDAITKHLDDFGMDPEITNHNAILGLSGARAAHCGCGPCLVQASYKAHVLFAEAVMYIRAHLCLERLCPDVTGGHWMMPGDDGRHS